MFSKKDVRRWAYRRRKFDEEPPPQWPWWGKALFVLFVCYFLWRLMTF